MRKFLFLIFTASGFSGLIYESIWTHYLKLFLGHAAYAQTLVLAIFMGGMAAGAWICSRYSVGWKNLLRGYAVAEGVIGVFALVFHPAFNGFLDLAYGAILPAIGSPAGVTAFKWTAAALLILPQSILLGMTFPLMSAGIIRRFPDQPGATVSMLYFTNSVGGAIGVLASGFVLIELVGLPGTIALAGLINVALAIVVWRLAARPEPPAPAAALGAAPTGAFAREEYVLLVSAALITGLASLMYEIGWIRMLSLVLGSSTHAFELMLSAFIFGLAFGGLWMRRRIDGIGDLMRYLGYVQIVMGLCALSTLLVYGWTFGFMRWMLEVLPKTDSGYSWFNLGSHAIALAVMLPATFCAGMTLPLITYALLRRGAGESSIGAVYSANTIGAIAGVFIAVHLGLPLLGLKGLMATAAGLDMALGVALLARAAKRGAWSMPPLAAAALCAAALFATLAWVRLDPHQMASGVYRDGKLFSATKMDVVDHRDGKTATINMTRHEDGLAIRTNGKVDAAVNMDPGSQAASDEVTMVLTGALPLLLHPQARTAANIGFGSGISSHVMLSAGTLEHLDTVEIEPAMVEVAKGFRPRNERAYTDPKSSIHYEDAKSFFSTHNKKYDIIVSEPSNPWVSGVAGLFSEEFYRTIGRHLKPDGMLVQWLQLYETEFHLVASVLKALGANFDDYAIFVANTGDILIVARNGAPIPAVDARLFQVPNFSRELARVGINGTQDVELRRIASKKLLAPVLQSIPIRANSDYYPVLDQYAVRSRFLGRNATELIAMATEPVPTLENLGVRRAASGSTQITPTPGFALTGTAYAATVFRDALAGKRHAPTPGVSRASAEKALEAAHRIEIGCRGAATGDDKVGGMMNVGTELVPFLRPEELTAVWAWMDAQPCGRDLSPLEAEWLKLFKGVGQREPQAMSTLAEALLAQDPFLTPQRRKYLVMVAMTGRLANGEKTAAQQIWKRYRPEILSDSKPLMLFRVLSTHSFSP